MAGFTSGFRGEVGVCGAGPARPAPNVPAEVLGSGQVKFLPALTPGLWLKNWGTQAGAAQPRGLCKHGRCSQVGLWGPQGPVVGRAQGWGWPEPWGGQCPRSRREWGWGGGTPNTDMEGKTPRETNRWTDADKDNHRERWRETQGKRWRQAHNRRETNGKRHGFQRGT